MTTWANDLDGTTEEQTCQEIVLFGLLELGFIFESSVPPRQVRVGCNSGAGAIFPWGQLAVLPPILFSNVAASWRPSALLRHALPKCAQPPWVQQYKLYRRTNGAPPPLPPPRPLPAPPLPAPLRPAKGWLFWTAETAASRVCIKLIMLCIPWSFWTRSCWVELDWDVELATCWRIYAVGYYSSAGMMACWTPSTTSRTRLVRWSRSDSASVGPENSRSSFCARQKWIFKFTMVLSLTGLRFHSVMARTKQRVLLNTLYAFATAWRSGEGLVSKSGILNDAFNGVKNNVDWHVGFVIETVEVVFLINEHANWDLSISEL